MFAIGQRLKREGARARFTCAAAMALLLVITGPAAAADRAAAKATTHTVAIDAVQFAPDTLTVHVGDTVVWVNKDPFPHTVTSKEGGFDSHEIAPGKSWSYKPRKVGAFPYICTLHSTMKATLRVE
jgi:plastocyanin